jgi:hypothetical protein
MTKTDVTKWVKRQSCILWFGQVTEDLVRKTVRYEINEFLTVGNQVDH